ncbi:EAL domain-containing protein [Citrobacter amalonaticus]|uniref:EAL domain-containing protein n=1 Tax=Citrobacter amalonaticus TaxID=35703 RepID=A0A2S4RYW8_CITAM|nr:EAL domain-containing protein [Citrobacter amalonaticus]POT57575.1 EAL domain-containing protein [Citrobacter amalonaticus]POT76898.1 EAL domain-containing protein [Citrobacter amalonaticus]POU65977.1 EAL domain-containing protein [Citrobacter amalonaticus]POV06134.1 EAL domain-containing protein [Citrobacter amalonaticus]
MNISLDNLYHSELCFLPARNEQHKLIGLEIVANFVSDDGTVRIPTELIMPRLSAGQHGQLFEEKLTLLETCQHFFIQHKLIAWIYLAPEVVDYLLTNDKYASRINRFPFLELMINEDFPELSKGKENQTLKILTTKFPLILSNFGAGDSSGRAVFDRMFKRVALDKNFIQQRAGKPSFEPFMRAIFAQISPCCESIMIAGIDSEEMLARVAPFGFSSMQGSLWPVVPAGKITTLAPR